MELWATVALFLIGFFILIKGANYLVGGATSLARVFNVSPWFIGIVIVGIGTSIPELSINIASVFNGNTIGLETIIGSNVFNILVILGLSALITPIVFRPVWVKRDLLLNVLAIVAAGLAILFPLVGDRLFQGVTRFEALGLLILFLLWLWFMYSRHDEPAEDADYKIFSFVTSFVLIVVGVVGVFFGGKWVVDGAEVLALALGVSPALVALTVVGAGTSLPELTVSIVALFKRHGSIAVGNVIGSNIFDFLGIIGIAGLLGAIPVRDVLLFDIGAALGAALLLFVLVFFGRRYILSRFEGIFLIAGYILYLVIVFMRG